MGTVVEICIIIGGAAPLGYSDTPAIRRWKDRDHPRARSARAKHQARPTVSVRESGRSQERRLKNSDITPKLV
jgi:hypothetical protein